MRIGRAADIDWRESDTARNSRIRGDVEDEPRSGGGPSSPTRAVTGPATGADADPGIDAPTPRLHAMTTIIRAEAAHDFLALVPHLVGYRPTRSLVCVGFEGSRTAGVLRHDLPPEDRIDAVAAMMLGTLCRLPRVDAVAAVVYGEAAFDGTAMPHRRILETLASRLEEAGFEVRDALCVATDGWGSLFDDDLPGGGHPLSMIEQSPAARRAAFRTRGGLADSPSATVPIPAPGPETAAAVRELLDALGDRGDRTEDALDRIDAVLGTDSDPLVLVERLAAGGITGAPEEYAWMVHLAASPPVRDAIMLQCAFGPLVGELALAAGDVSCRCADGEPCDADECDAEGAGVDAHPGGERVDGLLARLILGQSTIRPDADRIGTCLEALCAAIGSAPAGRRSGALCVAAWLAWAIGRGSAAGTLIDLALGEEPEHSMSRLLHGFFGSGALPEWAFSEALPRPDRGEGPPVFEGM
ncbi:hypothetical protein DSM26151_10320 [Agromyces marinus]|nr:hypothetical protein DSM26151_10320 [Agromyces marinus]